MSCTKVEISRNRIGKTPTLQILCEEKPSEALLETCTNLDSQFSGMKRKMPSFRECMYLYALQLEVSLQNRVKYPRYRGRKKETIFVYLVIIIIFFLERPIFCLLRKTTVLTSKIYPFTKFHCLYCSEIRVKILRGMNWDGRD